MNFKKYKTWIFDCDGVLLDSNLIKTESFHEVALPYGTEYAEALVSYHRQFGGVSRFAKFQYFFEHVLGRKEFQKELEEAIRQYSLLVRAKLLQCPETEGLFSFLEKIANVDCKIVVSGGMQEELRYIFVHRKLAGYFDGIYGSPDSKLEIIRKLLSADRLSLPAVFIGDSKYDYECANGFNIDFIFMYQYSEFIGWQDYFNDKPVNIISNLEGLECQIT